MARYLNFSPTDKPITLSTDHYTIMPNDHKRVRKHWPHLSEQQSLQIRIVQGHVPSATVQHVPVSPLMLSADAHQSQLLNKTEESPLCDKIQATAITFISAAPKLFLEISQAPNYIQLQCKSEQKFCRNFLKIWNIFREETAQSYFFHHNNNHRFSDIIVIHSTSN